MNVGFAYILLLYIFRCVNCNFRKQKWEDSGGYTSDKISDFAFLHLFYFTRRTRCYEGNSFWE